MREGEQRVYLSQRLSRGTFFPPCLEARETAGIVGEKNSKRYVAEDVIEFDNFLTSSNFPEA